MTNPIRYKVIPTQRRSGPVFYGIQIDHTDQRIENLTSDFYEAECASLIFTGHHLSPIHFEDAAADFFPYTSRPH